MAQTPVTVVTVYFEDTHFAVGYNIDDTSQAIIGSQPATVLIEGDGRIYVGSQAETRGVSQSLKEPGTKKLHLYRSCGRLLLAKDLGVSTEVDASDGHTRKAYEIFADILCYCKDLVRRTGDYVTLQGSDNSQPIASSSPNAKGLDYPEGVTTSPNGEAKPAETEECSRTQPEAPADEKNVDELYAKPRRRPRRSKGSTTETETPTKTENSKKAEAIQTFTFPPPPPQVDETDFNTVIPLEEIHSNLRWVIIVPETYRKRERIVGMRKVFDKSLKYVLPQDVLPSRLTRSFLRDLEAGAYFCICARLSRFVLLPPNMENVHVSKTEGMMVVSYNAYGAKFGAYCKSKKPSKNKLTELYAEWHKIPKEHLPREDVDPHETSIGYFEWLAQEIDKEGKIVVFDPPPNAKEGDAEQRRVRCQYVVLLGSAYDRTETFDNWIRGHNFSENSKVKILVPADKTDDVITRGGLYFGIRKHENFLVSHEGEEPTPV